MGYNQDATYPVAREIESAIARIPGAVDVHLHQVLDSPALEVKVDRARAAQLGLTQRDVANNLLISLSSSRVVSPNYWSDPRTGINYPVAVQTPQHRVDSADSVLLTAVAGGTFAAPQLLSNVSSIEHRQVASVVSHSNVQPVFDIYANVQNRDLGGVAAEVQRLAGGAGGGADPASAGPHDGARDGDRHAPDVARARGGRRAERAARPRGDRRPVRRHVRHALLRARGVQRPAANTAGTLGHRRGRGPGRSTDDGGKRMKAVWVVVGVAVLVVLLALGIVPRIQRNAKVAAEARDPANLIRAVSVVVPRRPDGQPELSLPGNVQAIQETPIYARTNGYLHERRGGICEPGPPGPPPAPIHTPEPDQEIAPAPAAPSPAPAALSPAPTRRA